MSEFIRKSHNVSVLLYHIVCPEKYRRVVISEEVDKTIKETCEEISKRYEIKFLEIGTEGYNVHFLVQSIPVYSPTKIVTTIKGIISRKVFEEHPEVKRQLWGGEFWSDGYFVSMVSKYGNEEVISNYVKLQGMERQYKQIQKKQLELF
ncbi:MAG: IS200/IS605 family transposase [Spirochaetaceae bacterium]|jgi:REP element-mobilizing transposase RayT|nr:IS200/IS605 family transposase [Spirochaetaceae bacterium]